MNNNPEIRCYETDDGLKFQIMDLSGITILKKQLDKIDDWDFEGSVKVLKEFFKD